MPKATQQINGRARVRTRARVPTARHSRPPGPLQLPQVTQRLRDPQESQGKLEEEAAGLGAGDWAKV